MIIKVVFSFGNKDVKGSCFRIKTRHRIHIILRNNSHLLKAHVPSITSDIVCFRLAVLTTKVVERNREWCASSVPWDGLYPCVVKQTAAIWVSTPTSTPTFHIHHTHMYTHKA